MFKTSPARLWRVKICTCRVQNFTWRFGGLNFAHREVQNLTYPGANFHLGAKYAFYPASEISLGAICGEAPFEVETDASDYAIA